MIGEYVEKMQERREMKMDRIMRDDRDGEEILERILYIFNAGNKMKIGIESDVGLMILIYELFHRKRIEDEYLKWRLSRCFGFNPR